MFSIHSYLLVVVGLALGFQLAVARGHTHGVACNRRESLHFVRLAIDMVTDMGECSTPLPPESLAYLVQPTRLELLCLVHQAAATRQKGMY